MGDAAAIPGDYQHRALTRGPAIQRHWHRSKLELLDWFWTPSPGSRVLDIGSGAGVFADRMATLGAEVVGVDANSEAVTYAQQTFGRSGLRFVQGYLDELDLPQASFDAATCLEVIEHVYLDQVRHLLLGLRRLLRPGGLVLITTPNYRGLWPIVEWLADHFSSVAKMDRYQHVTHFHRRMLRQLLDEVGFRVEAIQTYGTFAPFLAVLSARMASRLDRWERRVDLPFGNILVARARNP